MSKIIGNTTTTPVPRSDWDQVDKTKADFIRHKPTLGTIAEKDATDYYTKSEIDNMVLITIADIDDICGQMANPEMDIVLNNFAVSYDTDGNVTITGN